MNKNNYLQLLKNNNSILNIELDKLTDVVESFPYFQSARMLHLKKLKTLSNFNFNANLRKTAAHTIDRTVLFNYITQSINEPTAKPTLVKNKVEIYKPIIPKPEAVILKPETEILKSETDFFKPKAETLKSEIKVAEPKEDFIPEKKVHKIIDFNKNDKLSFNEWLQLSSVKQINRQVNEKLSEKQNYKIPEYKVTNKTKESKISNSNFDLIDKFIENNPKLKPPQKGDTIGGNIAKDSTLENEGWMTETLAQVYIEQHKYSKAIKTYKILSLKFPKKSAFFTDQIKAVKKLSENNKN